jgi:hypothetical protein
MATPSGSNLGNTRGGLRPATLTNLNTQAVVKFQFNPQEFTISKTNNWTERETIGLNIPLINFEKGGAQTVTLKIYFDTVESGKDVRTLTAPLWKMTMVDESSENSVTGKGQPPPVAFAWGSLYFRAVVTSISETLNLFSDKGVALRSEISISLQQYADEAPASQTGASGGGQAAPNTTVVQSGDRIDTASNSLSGSSDWRQTASKNNVDDPLKLRRGTTLKG